MILIFSVLKEVRDLLIMIMIELMVLFSVAFTLSCLIYDAPGSMARFATSLVVGINEFKSSLGA